MPLNFDPIKVTCTVCGNELVPRVVRTPHNPPFLKIWPHTHVKVEPVELPSRYKALAWGMTLSAMRDDSPYTPRLAGELREFLDALAKDADRRDKEAR